MKNDPRIITARFNSKCNETYKEIKKGEDCLYYPLTKTVYCLDSKEYQSFNSWKFDIDVLGYNY